jgi:hypothetical protein
MSGIEDAHGYPASATSPLQQGLVEGLDTRAINSHPLTGCKKRVMPALAQRIAAIGDPRGPSDMERKRGAEQVAK